MRAISHAASIKPFQRTKNGRDAWLALTDQHAGNDKWEAKIKRQEQLLHTRLWKGQSNFALERFVAQHRNACVSMQAAAENVTYQLPNEHSRVGFLLDAIQCDDAGLQAAMASVNAHKIANGLRQNFEAAATHLLPYDPVQKKRVDQTGGKRGSADVSNATGDDANISPFGAKKGIGSSGVSLHCHTKDEYDKLGKATKNKLREWRQKSESKGGKDKNQNKKPKYDNTKAIAAAVEKKVKEKLKAIEDDKTSGEEAAAFIMSVVQKHKGKDGKVLISDVTVDPAPLPTGPTLKSVLKQVKNTKTGDED
jgi:hypothetical protein